MGGPLGLPVGADTLSWPTQHHNLTLHGATHPQATPKLQQFAQDEPFPTVLSLFCYYYNNNYY